MAESSEPDLYGPWPKLPIDRWEPRSPSSEVLFQVVRDHLDDFLETVSLGDDGHGLPNFVEDELRAFIGCGDLRGGFARFQCRRCGFEKLLPFSCKGRGFCPSCMARRAAERSAHLIDHVIPIVPTRQYVLSLPVVLRSLVAFRHELCLEILGVFADALASFYQNLARDRGIADGRAGTVSVVQRFGGSLNLNPHFHVTALDGVFSTNTTGDLGFHEAPVPKQHDITVLCSIVRFRVLELLKARGFLEGDLDNLAHDDPLLASILAASATSRIATGRRAGQPVLRLVTLPATIDTRKQGRAANIDGFDLHAGAALAAGDRQALETLLRYQLRPPLSRSRLTRLDDGRLKLRLRTPYHDGTTHIILTPHELLERLAALVPRPRKNLIIYHGCLAPRARDREKIVAHGRKGQPIDLDLPLGQGELFDDDEPDLEPRRSRYYSWSQLMERVFGSQVLRCSKCDSSLRLIALVTAPFVIDALLTHIGLTTGPRKSPPPMTPLQLELFEPEITHWRQAATARASSRSPPT